MLSYSVYFEIKHQKWSICVSLLSTLYRWFALDSRKCAKHP